MRRVIAVFILAAAVTALLIFAQYGNTQQMATATAPQFANNETRRVEIPKRIPPSGFLLYENDQYGFSLFYPDHLQVREREEGQGASTIVFQDTNAVQGFQIFIVPYNEAEISEERFRADVPTGVRENVLETVVDGVTAVAFNSMNTALGETAEVWFIANSHLYEMTTLRPLESDLHQLLETFRLDR